MTQKPSYFFHPPGLITKSSILDVGLKCVHQCKFCYHSHLDGSDDQFSGMRRASFRTTAECKEILYRLKESGFVTFDVTGGEPTLHPEIVELMRYAHQELKLSGRVITLGQFLMRPMGKGRPNLIDELLDAGLTNFLFSYHAVSEDLFKAVTGGSFAKLEAAMSYLDERDFSYCSNTTVVEGNIKHLPDIARNLTKHSVYLHNFIIMNAFFEWAKKSRYSSIQASYTQLKPYLQEAVSILEDAGVSVNIRYAPLCTMSGLERNLVGLVGVRYNPYEWGNGGGHMGGSPEECATPHPIQEGKPEHVAELHLGEANLTDAGMPLYGWRGGENGSNVLKVFPKLCDACVARPVCDGVDPNYLRTHGDGEFLPYTKHPSAGALSNQRRSYRGAFLVKMGQDENMLARTKQLSRPAIVSTEPWVTTITPPYNQEGFLETAVRSALGQTWLRNDIVIVNDGSTDRSQEIAERLASENPGKITVINQKNSGQPAIARNNGIRSAKGDLILTRTEMTSYIAPRSKRASPSSKKTLLSNWLQLISSGSRMIQDTPRPYLKPQILTCPS